MWDVAEFRTHLSISACPLYLQEWGRSIQQMKSLKWPQDFFHYRFMEIFFRRSNASNSTVRGRKIRTRLAKRLYVDFSDAQWKITPLSMVRYGRNSNSFQHLCLASLPVKMKKIQSKMLEWPQHISHCKSMGIFPDVQWQLFPQSVVIMIKYPYNVYPLTPHF